MEKKKACIYIRVGSKEQLVNGSEKEGMNIEKEEMLHLYSSFHSDAGRRVQS